jgi:hypothetical protein
MNDIIEEVIIDHQEANKIRRFKLGLYFAVGVTSIIALCIGWWQHHTRQKMEQSQAMSGMLIKAMDDSAKDNTLAEEALDYITSKSELEITDLARLAKARVMFSSEVSEQNRMQMLEDIATHSKNELTKLYGKIMWMSAVLDRKTDVMTPQEISTLRIFAKSFDSDTSPFFGQASILRAALAMQYDKDPKAARQILNTLLASKQIMPLIQDQAQAFLANINFSAGFVK